MREAAGLTQAELAEMVGFRTPFYVSQLETGKRSAGLSVLSKICGALSIGLSEFFKEETPKVLGYRQTLILNLLEGISKEKVELIEKYIELAKDIDTTAIKETLLYAQKEKLWKEYSRKKKKPVAR